MFFKVRCNLFAPGWNIAYVNAPDARPPNIGTSLATPLANVPLVRLIPIHLATCFTNGYITPLVRAMRGSRFATCPAKPSAAFCIA